MPPAQPATPLSAVPARLAGADPEAVQHRQVQRAVWMFYLLDAALLAGFWATGAVPGWVPPFVAAFGTLVCGVAIALYAAPWWRASFADPLVTVNILLASGLQMLIATAAPQVGLLTMLTIVTAVATSSLRLPPRWLLPTVVTIGIAMSVVITASESALTAPAGTWLERLLTAVWCLWTLTKTVSVHVAGTQLRRQLADALARVERLATHDELTGLANRRHILELLEMERERMVRTGLPFAVALLDIDHFKQINDGHGHPAGDAVLREVAALLRSALRTIDRPGRLGGEEFLLLLHGPLDEPKAAMLGERLRTSLQSHGWDAVAPGLKVTACIGIAVSRPGEPGATLVERADRLLYECKRGGRNQVRVG